MSDCLESHHQPNPYTYEFLEMLEFREWAAKRYGITVIVKVNTEARERGIGYETHNPVTVTHELKTVALKQAIAEHKWDALITGILRDEDPPGPKNVIFPRATRIPNGTTNISRRSSGDNSR